MRYLCALFLLLHPALLADVFLDLCRHTTNSETRKTIDAIRDAIMEEGEHSNCEAIAARLTSKESLDLRARALTDLSPLSQLHNLKALYLSDNEIKNIWPLAGLSSLLVLDVRSNQIADIGVLPDMTQLQQVFLDNNNIVNIYPLKDLFKVERISLENNDIFMGKTEGEILEIKGLLESLIFFRSRCTINDYAPLDLNDIDETAIILNDMAARGDLAYFRALHSSANKLYVFDNQALWNRLDFATKKIMIAVSLSLELASFLEKQIITKASARLGMVNFSQANNAAQEIYLSIEEEIAWQRPLVERALQYFMMEPQARPPMTFNDTQALKQFFISYANQVEDIPKNHLLAVIRVYFSPYFVTRALTNWGNNARHRSSLLPAARCCAE